MMRHASKCRDGAFEGWRAERGELDWRFRNCRGRSGDPHVERSTDAPLALDEDTLAFARRVFQHVRAGHTDEMAELLVRGCRPTCATTRATAC